MKAKTTIRLHGLHIRSMDRKSSVTLGKAHSNGNHVFNHRNEGFGEQSGDGVIQNYPVSVVEDSDFIDFNVIKR
ncbi:YocN [Bacillus freudenreichii]|nr:YocN [Bacillus freudenreichii]